MAHQTPSDSPESTNPPSAGASGGFFLNNIGDAWCRMRYPNGACSFWNTCETRHLRRLHGTQGEPVGTALTPVRNTTAVLLLNRHMKVLQNLLGVSDVIDAIQQIDDRLANLLSTIQQGIKKMSVELDALSAQVANNNSVIDSAVTLIQGFHDQLVAAGTDPVALQALADSLAASDKQLADAVAQNTPAAPPATP